MRDATNPAPKVPWTIFDQPDHAKRQMAPTKPDDEGTRKILRASVYHRDRTSSYHITWDGESGADLAREQDAWDDVQTEGDVEDGEHDIVAMGREMDVS